jgi:hypothetical protein
LSAPAKVSLATQIAEVRREIGKRREVYPRLVGKGSMRQAEADLLISHMEAVLSTLQFLKDNESVIRDCIAARHGGAA